MRRLIAVGLSAVILAGALYWVARPKNDFAAGNAGREVVVAVQEGATGSQIATDLKSLGVIKTRQAFLNVIYSDDRAKRIQPGGHRVQTKIPAALALDQLLDPKRRVGVITFPEGLRASAVVARLKASGIDATGALQRVKAPLGAKKIEGFLYPGQYAFVPNTTGEAALGAMVARFEREQKLLEDGAQAINSSPYEALIIASLLQAEGAPQDYDKILRVILNRLTIGMPLQIDATVLYALGETGRIRVTYNDLAVRSPYNTYKVRGLPPTPICNPGEQAIAALSSPASGDWLYYITVKPGDTRFTRSHDEFLQWKVEYRRNYRNGLFK